MSENKAIRLSDSEVFRFSKLQDLIGQTIINQFLELTDHNVLELTLIDKINLFEKMNIFKASRWQEFRDLLNHLAPEYPDRPDLCADFLQKPYDSAPELSLYLQRIFDKLTKIKNRKL